MSKNKNIIKQGLINHDWYAHYRHSMTESGWTSDRFGFEILHGAIQATADYFKVSVTDRHSSGSIKEIDYWNDGETPSIDLLTGRMLSYDKPDNPPVNAISKRTLGFKKESHRSGCWLTRSIPGPNGKVLEMVFSYYMDQEGEDLISKDDYTFETFTDAKSMRWALLETDAPNDELFPSGNGLLFKNYIFEDGPIDINLEQMQENFILNHSECGLEFEFTDMGTLLPRLELRHRVMNEYGELLRSFKEFQLCGDTLVIKYKNKTLKFKVRFAHRLMRKPDRLRWKEYEKLIKNFIEYKIKGKRHGAPLLSLIGPKNIILSAKDGHDWWDKHQKVIGSNGEKIGTWNYESYQGLEIYLEPLQSMSDYFSNVKTSGLTDSKLDDLLEQEMAVFIKQRDEFISPYFEASQKEEDDFVDQVVNRLLDKKQGRELRQSYSEFGFEMKSLLSKRTYKLRKTRGGIVDLFELDLQTMTDDCKGILEFQIGPTDYKHLLGLVARMMIHRNDVDFMVWAADKHNHMDELIQLMEEIKEIAESKIKKVYLITNKQAIEGFEMDDIEVIHMEENKLNYKI